MHTHIHTHIYTQLLPQYSITSFKPNRYFSEAHFVFLLVFVYECGKESLCVFDTGPRAYFHNTSRLANFCVAVLVFLVLVTQLAVMEQLAHFTFDQAQSTPFSGMLQGDGAYDDASVLVFTIRAQKSIMAWVVVLALLRTVTLLSGSLCVSAWVQSRLCV